MKGRKLIALLSVFALLLASLPVGGVFAADPPINVQTQAVVPQGGGAGPTIEWKWELADYNSNQAGMQYGQDDDPLTTPVNPPFTRNMTQILPNPENLPETRKIEYWMAVTDTLGIADILDVFWNVYEPTTLGGTTYPTGGTLKYQIHGVKVACSALGTEPLPTNGNTTVFTPMMLAAIATGQITGNTSSGEAWTIVNQCYKGTKAIYHYVQDLGISKDQPWGEYRVEATAVGQSSSDTKTNWFDILPFIALRIDFSQVNFDTIAANTGKSIPGDMIFNPSNDQFPTVKNVGNALLYLHLIFSTMTGVNHGKFITSFDAQLNAQKIDPIAADQDVCFNNTTLSANALGQLDLSIHPGPIPSDTYTGTLSLIGSQTCP